MVLELHLGDPEGEVDAQYGEPVGHDIDHLETTLGVTRNQAKRALFLGDDSHPAATNLIDSWGYSIACLP